MIKYKLVKFNNNQYSDGDMFINDLSTPTIGEYSIWKKVEG